MPLTTRREYFYLHLAVALFGLAGLFGRWLDMAPIHIVQGRTVFAALSLLIILLMKKEFKLQEGRFYFRTAILGFVLAFHWLAFFEAIQNTSIALALLSFASFPFFTLILEWLGGQGKPGKMDFILVFLSLLGTTLIVPFESDSPDLIGVLWGLSSGFSFALLAILNRRWVQKTGPIELAFYQDAFAALFLIPFSLMISWEWNSGEIGLLLILGIVFTALSHSLFVAALVKVKARTASLVAALEPVYGIVAAYFLFKEIPTGLSVIGGSLILGAGLLAQLRNSD